MIESKSLSLPEDTIPASSHHPILASGRGIHPFCQQPPRQDRQPRLAPEKIFILFTAEIIKADIVFTR